MSKYWKQVIVKFPRNRLLPFFFFKSNLSFLIQWIVTLFAPLSTFVWHKKFFSYLQCSCSISKLQNYKDMVKCNLWPIPVISGKRRDPWQNWLMTLIEVGFLSFFLMCYVSSWNIKNCTSAEQWTFSFC